MTTIHFDTLRAAHLLDRIQTEPDMRADAFLERSSTDRLIWNSSTTNTDQPGRQRRFEEGLAIRLVTPTRSWLESRDDLGAEAFADALRRAARSLSSVPMAPLAIERDPWPAPSTALRQAPKAIEQAIRKRRAAFPFDLDLLHHQRELALAGPSILAEPQIENFLSFSASIRAPDSAPQRLKVGGLFAPESTSGFSTSDADALGAHIAALLVERFRARTAAPPKGGRSTLVLSPHASSILLHEAVSHALEVDLLSVSGNPQDAVGIQLGNELLDVLEDPSSAPAAVRRTNDDEGSPTSRRWLLRQGRVAQPIADVAWSERHPTTDPGCGRRSSRHDLVGPRSHFLQLLSGETRRSDLLQGEGVWLDQISRGSLEPTSGEVRLVAACGRRFAGGELQERVGPFALRGHLVDLLGAVTAVGDESEACGAGWCAKDGQQLPVWARSPALRMEDIEVTTA